MGIADILNRHLDERTVDRVEDRAARTRDNTTWLRQLAQPVPIDGPRGGHGWLGCCLTHDLTHERLADAADADRCDECGTTVPAGTGIRQTDDPQMLLCPLCDEEWAEVARDARLDEEDDWRADR